MDNNRKKLEIGEQSTIFVSNFKNLYNDDEKELIKAFSAFGEIVAFTVLINHTGEKIGYIQYADPADAKMAVKYMNNSKNDVKIGLLTGIGNSNVILHVKNLAQQINDDELRSMFDTFGNVKTCSVKINRNKEPMGFGFVTFLSSDDAMNAKSVLDKKIVHGKRLSINFWQEKHHRDAYLLAFNENLIKEPEFEPNKVQKHILQNSKRFDLSINTTNNSQFSSTQNNCRASMKRRSSFISKTSSLLPTNRELDFDEYAMKALHTPIQTDLKTENNGFCPELKMQGPFIQDKFLMKSILTQKIEEECKKYSELIVKELMQCSTIELNMIIKCKDLLQGAVKDKMRNIVFD